MFVRLVLALIVMGAVGCDPAWQIRVDVREGPEIDVRELVDLPASRTLGPPVKDARIDMRLRSSSGGDFGLWTGESDDRGSAVFHASGPWGDEELWGEFTCVKSGFRTVTGTCRFERSSGGQPAGRGVLVIMPRQEESE
jgi:hypothetical protein